MYLRQAIIDSIIETVSMFGVITEFDSETEIEMLGSASQVNVIIGLTLGAKGNIILGLDESAAFKLASAMMGGAEVTSIGTIEKSALGELLNMVIGHALDKVGPESLIDISPPTLVTGKRISLMFGKIKSYRLKFTLDEEVCNITYSVE